jgi:hypothetical protein
MPELSDVSTTLNMTAQGLSRAFFKESKSLPTMGKATMRSDWF